MHKHELVALCHSRGLSFAVDPTNKDTFFARNHLRKLMGSQQAIAACTLQEVAGHSPSQALATELACEDAAAPGNKSDISTGQRETSAAARELETEQQTPSSGLTADALRVMAACTAASQKLQRDADLLLKQARLPGPTMLLEIERLRESSKHVAVRALSEAIVVRGLSTLVFDVEQHLLVLCIRLHQFRMPAIQTILLHIACSSCIRGCCTGDQSSRRGCSGVRNAPQRSYHASS